MNKISISLDIDETELKKLLDTRLSERSKQEIRERLDVLFANPHYQYHHDGLMRRYPNDPDISAGWKAIDNMIAGKLLDEKFQAFTEKYIEENFERILVATLEKAMQHKANQIAFGPDARSKMKVEK